MNKKKVLLSAILVVSLIAVVSLLIVNISAAPSTEVTYDIESDWGSGAIVNVTIKNVGSLEIEGWSIEWTFPGNQKIDQMWGGSFTQNGTNIIAKNIDWNSKIGAGESVSFGCMLTYSGSNNKPTDFKVNSEEAVETEELAETEEAVKTEEPVETEEAIEEEPQEASSGEMLSRSGNPALAKFNNYKDYTNKVDNILSYQLDCGGWPKNVSYDSEGSGGNDNGTFDNGATTMEMTVMADAYNKTGDVKYRDSARKALDYIFEAQYSTGGWPQFYPLRGGYSDHVTFNDDAMSRVVTLLQLIEEKQEPFNTDVFTDSQRSKIQKSIDGGVDYILKAQIKQNGKLTAWCAQHGKDDYEPKKAREYEHPSISGSESVEIIGFLMMQPQTSEIKNAVKSALTWFRSEDTYFVRDGDKTWWRFYDIPTNKPIFSNYDGVIWIGEEYEDKKKSGYSWSGGYGDKIIKYADSVGY